MVKQDRSRGKEEPVAYPTLRAAARAASLSRQTLTQHLHEIEHRRLKRRVVISKAALLRWLEGYNEEQN